MDTYLGYPGDRIFYVSFELKDPCAEAESRVGCGVGRVSELPGVLPVTEAVDCVCLIIVAQSIYFL